MAANNYKDFDFGDDAFYGLADKITTSSQEARDVFRKAMGFSYGFVHEEAIAAYTKVSEIDPDCAMAYWGIAWAMGPHYNWPPGFAPGYDIIQKAVALKDKVSELERELIVAMAARSSQQAKEDFDPTKNHFGTTPELNKAFSDAMAPVAAKYPDNLDVIALYVESLMNLNPWKLWNRADGKITAADDNTNTIVALLEKSLSTPEGAKHPAICHLYCHAMELSPTPEKALPAADALRTAVPDSGHLVHMPSHIDAWVGGYEAGVKCNVDGTAADERFVERTGKESCFYKFYRMHNMHFVVWMAMFEGQYGTAMEYARKIEAASPAGDKDSGVQFMLSGIIPMGAVFIEAFHSVKYHAMIRFGKWEELLAEPLPENKEIYPVSIAVAHYSRGIAFASTNRVKEAEEEQKLYLEALENPAILGRLLHNNPWHAKEGVCISAVATSMLAGEIEYRKGNHAVAFDHLRKAAELDDGLNYDEPWGWMAPARHALGALLLEQGNVEEATKVYQKDLATWKDNMWGLFGLKKCLEAAGKAGSDEHKDVKARFEKASARADVKFEHTCFCAGVSK